MLEGKDPTLCHPGCVHQPVTSLEAPSHILSTGTTHPTWHTPPISGLGLRARTALLVREVGDPSTPRTTLGGASNGVLGVGLLEKKWTQTSLTKESVADGEGVLGATASHRPEAEQLVVTGGHPAAAGVSAAASPARPHSAHFLTCPSPSSLS